MDKNCPIRRTWEERPACIRCLPIHRDAVWSGWKAPKIHSSIKASLQPRLSASQWRFCSSWVGICIWCCFQTTWSAFNSHVQMLWNEKKDFLVSISLFGSEGPIVLYARLASFWQMIGVRALSHLEIYRSLSFRPENRWHTVAPHPAGRLYPRT